MGKTENKQSQVYVPSILFSLFQRFPEQVEYEHDILENDTGKSASECSHIHHDSSENWSKVRTGCFETKLMVHYPCLPKSKKYFWKRFFPVFK